LSADVNPGPPGAVGLGTAENLAGHRRDITLTGDQMTEQEIERIPSAQAIVRATEAGGWRAPSGQADLLLVDPDQVSVVADEHLAATVRVDPAGERLARDPPITDHYLDGDRSGTKLE
jgi:hypothetical protein